MKNSFNILLLLLFVLSCSNTQSTEVEKSENIAVKSLTEYLDGTKIHYRQYDRLGNELLHIYFKEENQEEKEIFTYDARGNRLTEKLFLNDSLLEAIEYSYKFDNKFRPTKITSNKGDRSESKIIEYCERNDTIVETLYQTEQDFKERKWLKETLNDKTGKWLGTHYNKIYGGFGDGDQIINYYDNINGKLDFQIHPDLRFDTTFFQYNEQGQLIKTSEKKRGREEYGDFEYDKFGNKIKWTIIKIIYYQGDALKNVWTYDWKKI